MKMLMKLFKGHGSQTTRVGLLFLGVAVIIVAIHLLVPNPPDRDYPTPIPSSSMDERTGRCRPDGLTQSYADVNNDGKVDCSYIGPEKYAVFLADSEEEARKKRKNFLVYMIREDSMLGGYDSPEQAEAAIQDCGGELYLLHRGTTCADGHLLPYPGTFPIWVSRDSKSGKAIQAAFDALKAKK